jgi:hypothetical protein
MFEAKPTAKADVDINIKGAYIACWVNDDDIHAARHRGIQYVEEEGWEVIAEEGFQEIFPEFLERHTESYTIYQATLRQDCTLLFYYWLDGRIKGGDNPAMA